MVAVHDTTPRGRRFPSADELLELRRDDVYQQNLKRRLSERVAQAERAHGLASADIAEALHDGRLEESFEVCVWLMDYEMLRRTEEQPERR